MKKIKRPSTFRLKSKYQVILLGKTRVGKSSILRRFVDEATMLEPITTVGAEFRIKSVCAANRVIRLKIWDAPGQERFRALLDTYYSRCKGAIIVYDIQCRASFEDARDWVVELRGKLSSDLVIILAGNKVDMETTREISKSEAKNFAELHNVIFMETSSASGENVNECFMELANALCGLKGVTPLDQIRSPEGKQTIHVQPSCWSFLKSRRPE